MLENKRVKRKEKIKKVYRYTYTGKRAQELRKKVIEFLGGKCAICGFNDSRALQIDHIEGGGTRLNKSTSWSIRYKAILSGTNTIKVQILCANCNWIKRYINNEK